MIFYHFTACATLIPIAREGLAFGAIYRTAAHAQAMRNPINAVWLTENSDPNVPHGLTTGRDLLPHERERQGVPDGEPARFDNKLAVRFRLTLSSSDGKLKRWPRWAKQNLDAEWLEALINTGGGPDVSNGWWLYFGNIPADKLDAICTTTNEPVPGWPGAFK
jgi:hypothetical protein